MTAPPALNAGRRSMTAPPMNLKFTELTQNLGQL
jgi:hypothetical protein